MTCPSLNIQTRYHWLFSLFLTFALTTFVLNKAEAAEPIKAISSASLSFKEGKLSARLSTAPLRQVMAELSRLSGARVVWFNTGGEETISAEFPALPLDEALQRLLPRKNFLLLYMAETEEPKLTQIWITSLGQGGNQFVITPQSALAAPLAPMVEEQSGENVIEETESNNTRMIDTALDLVQTTHDAARRVETIELLQSHVKEDPRIRTVLTQLAYDNADAQVQAAAATALAGME